MPTGGYWASTTHVTRRAILGRRPPEGGTNSAVRHDVLVQGAAPGAATPGSWKDRSSWYGAPFTYICLLPERLSPTVRGRAGGVHVRSNHGSMNPADTALAARPRLVAVTAEAIGADPMLFLRQTKGGPRGFWARGDRWVAHAGAVATLSADGHSSNHRFSAVEEEAHDLFEVDPVTDGGRRTPSRFYGGFSFRSDHSAVDLWAGFTPALFHLPQLELEGRHRRPPRLTARAVVGSDEGEADAALSHLLTRTGRLSQRLRELSGAKNRPPPSIRTTKTESDRSHWDAAVTDALAAIAGGEVSKVVLARTMDVVTEDRLDPVEVVQHLWEENRGSHVFLFEPADGCPLVGAAPETVAAMSKGVFHATAVGGTVARGETPEEQEALQARLLQSEKDAVEHRIALDDMVARLRALSDDVEAQPEPHVLTLARIQHLETEIRASVPERTSVLTVLEALHPTPAVCGLPRDGALEFLSREEPFERGWYAGPVGWFDLKGDGAFAPALRCAVARDHQWRLFAGAGIVAGSDPGLEWEETSIKFEPVLRALAASGAR